MGEVKVLIDGRDVIAEKGMTIMEAAELAGISIPRLCHINKLIPSGVCRICVVELEGYEKLVGSCHTPINDGMVIHTTSDRVLAARKAIIELLLAAHTGPCVTDGGAKECELHKIASMLEVAPDRFRVKEPRFYQAEDTNPYVRRDMSKCILCRRCIRVCDEIAKKSVLSVAYRGFGSKVVVDCDQSLNKEVCRDCGMCIDYCPTNALAKAEGETHLASEDAKVKNEISLDNKEREQILSLLNEVQSKFGHVSEEAMIKIGKSLSLSLSEIYGIATFYSFISMKPVGKNVIRICQSIPCYLKNSPMIMESVEREIGIKPGEITSDGKFSFELTNCIGACDKAPAMLINREVYGNLTPSKISKILQSYS